MDLKNIFMVGIKEPYDNELKLLFSKSLTSETPETIALGNIELKDVYSINIDSESPLIQLKFERYIAYSIRNESFTAWDDYEEFEGRIFRIYRKSRYLDYIQLSTIASEDYPGPYKHYGIACLNHIIDVVSTEEPLINEIMVK
jgi:hypothetical protein